MYSAHQAPTTEIIAAARTFIGASFHHQGRRAAAMDCIGLIVLAHRAAGYRIDDYTTYARQPNPAELLRYTTINFDRQDGSMRPGDIALFQYRKRGPQHAAILTEGLGLIHTWADVGRVVECDMDSRWLRILHSHWRVKEERWQP